jgi:branched-chain amino acid transport system substrate-binding protein
MSRSSFNRAASFLLLFSFLALFAMACATPQATVEEQSAYDRAAAVQADDPEEAARQLEAFLRTHQDSPLAEEAAFRRAQIALDANERSKAVFWLGWMVRNHPRGEHSDIARVKLARLYAQTGDVEMARQVLVDVRIRRLTPEQKRMAYRLRAEVSDDRAERVQWLAASRAEAVESGVSEAALELIDAEIVGAVDALSLAELRRAWNLLDGRPPAGRVALRLAQENMDLGEYDDAGHDLRVASRLDLVEADHTLLEELSLRMELYESGRGVTELLPSFAEVAAQPEPAREQSAGRIGAVLPLSGPYASYGEESLRGILLATGIFGSDEPSGIQVIVRDSAGDPARAAAAVRDLAANEDVAAIVGPLRSSASEAAARAAEEEGVPLVALTTREEVPRDRPFVFRLRTTPEDELRYLVAYAFEELGARRFAVLYPDDGYGRGMRDHFWKMVEERGGWLVAAASYKPDSTDFGSAIREMIGYSLLTRSESGALVERESFLRRGRRLPTEHASLAREIAEGMIGPEGVPLPPVVDFDALFIPDGYEQIGLLAPQLAFHELTGVQLLGAGDWYHPELIEIAQEHVSGAVISALFDADSRFSFVADFVDGYRTTFASEPDAFSAHAYDAANIVLVQLARGFETRDAMREGILRTQAYPGASGVTSLRPDGNARKRPFLLQVEGKRIVPLD